MKKEDKIQVQSMIDIKIEETKDDIFILLGAIIIVSFLLSLGFYIGWLWFG